MFGLGQEQATTFCMDYPTDPMCGGGQVAPQNQFSQYVSANHGFVIMPTASGAIPPGAPATTPPPPSQTPISPDKIVTTTGLSWWAKIPTWAKIAGGVAIAFVGYKKFVAKPRTQLSGARRRRR